MIEAVMLWNEPNNLSHWDFGVDPEWEIFARMVRGAGDAVQRENPSITRVLGGISPVDAGFMRRMGDLGVLDSVDAVAIHGFPVDWNHWPLDEWPDRVAEIEDVAQRPVWVSEVGVSSFGAEQVQEFGLRATAELLIGRAERIHWYSLFDLPKSWPATSKNPEAEGSAYYRHFYMGLIREDGCPKRALKTFAEFAPDLGLCQWFHYRDHRLDSAVQWMRDLGVRRLRTGLSWADSFRSNAYEWFDRQMEALEPFDTTITFGYTPEALGIHPSVASPPRRPEDFADFCAAMVRRYAPVRSATRDLQSAIE
jgi:beta-xylosidase